jgi:hypothetical protein
MVVLREREEALGLGVVLGDGAEVAVEQAGHPYRYLQQVLGEVDLAGERDGRVDEHVDLALAGQLRGQVIAADDGPGEVVDVALVDAAVAAGGARAGEEAGRGPAADRDPRHTEPPCGLLDAQKHGGT